MTVFSERYATYDKRMKIKLIAIFLIFIGIQVKSQNIDKVSAQICDSIRQISIETNDTLELIRRQIELQSSTLQDTLLLLELTKGNVKNNINVFYYKLNRYLNKNCSDYKLKNSILLGLTSILDVEGILTSSEIDSIEDSARDLLKQKKVRLIIVTIDDFYPYKDINDYATNQANNWHIGSKFEKGGIVLVISKSLRKVRISTSHISQQFLTDIESQDIIDNTLIPRFKTGEYYQAILEFINDVRTKI